MGETIVERMERWADHLQARSARIRAKTALHSQIFQQVTAELVAEISRPRRLMKVDQAASMRAVEAETKRRLAMALNQGGET